MSSTSDVAPVQSDAGRLAQTPAIVAGIIATIGIVTIVIAFLVWGGGGFKALPAGYASGLLSMGVGATAATIHLIVGWLLIARVPRNPIGWLLLAGGLTFAMVVPVGLLVSQAQQAFRPAPALTLELAWAQSSFGIPILAVCNLTALLLFPDGRPPSRRWWVVGGMTLTAGILVGLAAALDPAGLLWYPTLPNPAAAPSWLAPALTNARSVGVSLALVTALLVVASLVARYRIGNLVVRAQLRWIVFAALIQIIVFVPFIVTRYVGGAPADTGEIFVSLGEAGSAAIPIAAAIAITRYHLFGIDTLISRTIVYLLLMAILGGASTAVATISGRMFTAATGQTSDIPLVLTVFMAAAAYTPVRRSLEGVVDGWRRQGASPSREAGPEPAAVRVPPEVEDEAVFETARSLVALRRFEQRFADPTATTAGAEAPPPKRRRGRRRAAVLPIDEAGAVPCPRRGAVSVTACLACPDLKAFTTSPPTISCYAKP
jgi:hypothetical protein